MNIEVKVLIGVALTSLAGAAVFYIAFLVAVDEVRKDMVRGSEEIAIIVAAILLGVGLLGI